MLAKQIYNTEDVVLLTKFLGLSEHVTTKIPALHRDIVLRDLYQLMKATLMEPHHFILSKFLIRLYGDRSRSAKDGDIFKILQPSLSLHSIREIANTFERDGKIDVQCKMTKCSLEALRKLTPDRTSGDVPPSSAPKNSSSSENDRNAENEKIHNITTKTQSIEKGGQHGTGSAREEERHSSDANSNKSPTRTSNSRSSSKKSSIKETQRGQRRQCIGEKKEKEGRKPHHKQPNATWECSPHVPGVELLKGRLALQT